MFTWKPIYRELAEALMGYRERQGELLAMIKTMQAKELPAISLKDEAVDGHEAELDAIDPFTFFANFNRANTEDGRRGTIAFLKERFALKAPVPADFQGIPVVHMQDAWFFPSASKRDKGDIPALWDLAEACLRQPPAALDATLFKRCRAIRRVGTAKLTMGLFWFNPVEYLALDHLMGDYLATKSVLVKLSTVNSLADYAQVVANARAKLGTDFVQVSQDAYVYSNQVPLTDDELDAGLQSLLRQMAERNHVSVERVVAYLAQQPDSESRHDEIRNRLAVFPELGQVLSQPVLDLDALRKTSAKLWVLTNGQDATRRNAFLGSGHAREAIATLFDEASGVGEYERIDTFVKTAFEHGYKDPKGQDTSGAAQFASVLLSAVHPERYVDYRDNRWNRLFALISGTAGRLCTGSSYGWKLARAGKFAVALAATPTFRKYFGAEHGTWKASVLAWQFKEGLFDMEAAAPPKRYWAGGFLWGKDESHLAEFLQGDFWQTGFSRDGTSERENGHWALFDQIRPGDEFVIKGLGGRNDLRAHYVGEVREVIPTEGKVLLAKLDRPLYRGKAPKHGGAGNWFGTLLELTDPEAIRQVFHGETPPPDPVPLPDYPLNLILCGPPGTGKTYRARHRAVDTILGPDEVRTDEDVQRRFDELMDAGRIAFITFHQSYGYEDFVEGIRPDVDPDSEERVARYECRDGVFKRLAVEALYAALERPATESKESEFDERWTRLVGLVEESPEREYKGLTEKTKYRLALSPRGNISGQNLVNPAASGYTCSRRYAKEVFLAYPGQPEISIRQINETLGVGCHAHLITVVLRELASLTVPKAGAAALDTRSVSYDKKKEAVLAYLEKRDASGYQLRSDNGVPRYVLVIDEINRGNISKILGELVTLLEADKRVGGKWPLRAALPCSQEKFGVPQNLYIVGTMNTADKSIALVDVALRRRFRFEEQMPDLDRCTRLPPAVRAVLEKLNTRITLRKDRDHQIGHSYFLEVTTEEEFNLCFRADVIPLLQEYFYNDWDGLRFVLGEDQKEGGGFVRRIDGADSKWVRSRWQWWFDGGTDELHCLRQLQQNYGRAGGPDPHET